MSISGPSSNHLTSGTPPVAPIVTSSKRDAVSDFSLFIKFELMLKFKYKKNIDSLDWQNALLILMLLIIPGYILITKIDNFLSKNV